VISLAVGELFIGQNGGLAILHSSGLYLETLAHWGDEVVLEPSFLWKIAGPCDAGNCMR